MNAPTTLADEIAALPAGTLYLERHANPWVEDFDVKVRGLQVVATVCELRVGGHGGTNGVWTVTVTDRFTGHLAGSIATATISGSRRQAAKQAMGLVHGIALNHGVEPSWPSDDDIHIYLA